MAQPGIKIPNENPSLQKENDECKKIQELSVERGKKLKEQQEELEKMHRELEKYKKDNNTLRKKADEKDDSIRELQKKLDHYQQVKWERNHILSRLNSVAGARQNIHFPEIDIADQSNNDRSEENVSILSKDNKNIQDTKIQTAEEKIQSLQTENSSLILALAKKSTEMRSLERLKSKCDDQLLLAKGESKRLQGKISDLHGENNQLRRDIDDLSKQKEDALARLSKVAGAKLTHGNAAITDLSDTDRPTKLAEKFSELYDNAWTDAFEELDNTFQNEEKTIKVLLRIFQEAYKFCVLTENNYEARIGHAVFSLANETESRQITNTNVGIQKVLADLRISLSTACCSVVEEMLVSKLPFIMKSVDVAACPLTKLFARQCASLSWKMRIRDPPLFVRFEFRCGSTFNSDLLKKYTKTGGYLDFLIWPTLYLHENGPVLAKGLAQPKIAP